MPELNEYYGRILVIEDNIDIATLLIDFFSEKGHIVDYASDGLVGLNLLSQNDFDMILLDLALPGIDGINLCKNIREVQKSFTPVLMLTARDSVDEKLIGFEAGADDYLVKPFDLNELYARVKALWRRTIHAETDSVLAVSDLLFDSAKLSVKRNDESIKLNPVRLKILRFLMENTHRVVAKKEIETYIWGDEPTESDALRTHMSALRQAIDKPFNTPLLQTIHGVGYRLYDSKAE